MCTSGGSQLLSFKFLAIGMEAAAAWHGFMGSPAQLLFLDLRFGYSPNEAWLLVEEWAPEGRHLYLMVEAIDCLLYHIGYRGACLVVINCQEADIGAVARLSPGNASGCNCLLSGKLEILDQV